MILPPRTLSLLCQANTPTHSPLSPQSSPKDTGELSFQLKFGKNSWKGGKQTSRTGRRVNVVSRLGGKMHPWR